MIFTHMKCAVKAYITDFFFFLNQAKHYGKQARNTFPLN